VRPARAYDFRAASWRLCVVECRQDANYDGSMVTLDVGISEVTATAYHPFWVMEGRDLEIRPALRHVDVNEDRHESLPGRWVNSHDVHEGDVVFLRDRGPVTVRRVMLYHQQRPVCNLTIQGLHTFAVGDIQLLVHNTSGSDATPTDTGVRKSINPSSEDIVYRETPLERTTIDEVSPFNQAASDAGGQPIRAVVTPDGKTYIMQGNHRVYGASEQGLQNVEGLIYTPEHWAEFTESPFTPGGTNNPEVVP